MTVIACLHAAESNIDLYEQSLRALDEDDIQLLHRVESDLFAQTQTESAVTPAIVAATRQAIEALCQQADAVIVTCTTLGSPYGRLNSINRYCVLIQRWPGLPHVITAISWYFVPPGQRSNPPAGCFVPLFPVNGCTLS